MDEPDIQTLAAEIEQGIDTIDVPAVLVDSEPEGQEISRTLAMQIQMMAVGQRLKLAMKGNRDARMILLRDSSRMVQRFVLTNPRITDEEVVGLCKNRSIEREMLDLICRRKEWTSNYQVKLALATNPKTPLVIATRLVPTLLPRDLRALAKSKNVPSVVCGIAKRLVVERGG
ncbi:MAG: hypothetical protein ABI629_08175 [bacterium]